MHFFSFLAGCQTGQKIVTTAKPNQVRSIAKGLSEAHAMHRSQYVSNVSYDLDLDLMDSRPKSNLNSPEQYTHFNGKLVLEFDLSETVPLTLDFSDGEFKSVSANGHDLDIKAYNKFFLPLPADSLVKGKNQLIIVYRQKFANNGAGLYKFTDKEDKNIYLYTQFEPYDANAMFPSFDQPDLKATYQMKLRAPSSWQVISTANEEKIVPGADSRIWYFPKTAKISTYVFSLHAGPYSIWSSQYRGASGTIPLRLFARKTMAKYVNPNDWFTFTKNGFKYFENYYSYPYPFKKYDQLIVPDFNYGAMENVGAVTFSEHYVQRGKTTEMDRERLANTLLHEMAHMWFGDLVTMKWWNDLWLNESFATFMATKAVVATTKFKNPWQSFYSTKKWAYWTDQLVTTHPIEDNVPTTEEAFTNFDGITYGKGASTLKQINFLIGEPAYQAGLKSYFKNFAYQNTRRNDFTSALAVAAQTDLHKWTETWLQTAGVNSIEASYLCADGKITSFELRQTAPTSHPTIRSHKTQVGLFSEQNGKLNLTKTQTVLIADSVTPVNELTGASCPDLVYPNYEDQAYFKVILDHKTLEKLPKTLSKVPDTLARTMLWDDLWNMVRDAQLSLEDYTKIAIENIPLEQDEKILQQISQSLSRSYNSVQSYLPTDASFAGKRTEIDAKIESTLWNLLSKASPGSDRQKMLFSAYVSSVETTEGFHKLQSLITQQTKVAGLNFDQDLRWNVVRQLAHFDNHEVEAIIENESKRDTSDWGKKHSLSAKSARPSLKNKKAQFNLVINAPSSTTLGDLKAIMGSTYSRRDKDQKLALAEEYFSILPKISKEKDSYFLENFAEAYLPLNCSISANQKVKSYLSQNKDLPYQVIKDIRVAVQEDERCHKIQSLMLQAAPTTVTP